MIDEKLKSLNITLPTPPKPAGAYIPVVISDQIVYVSGQIPIEDGKVAYKGKVPTEQSLEQAQMAAKLCLSNVIAHKKRTARGSGLLVSVTSGLTFVNSSPD